MKKYFNFVDSGRLYKEDGVSLFLNRYSAVLTSEDCGSLEYSYDGDGDKVSKIRDVSYSLEDVVNIDMKELIANAEKSGYKLNKTECTHNKFKWLLKYKDYYYCKLSFLDIVYRVIDNGEVCKFGVCSSYIKIRKIRNF